jgi:hypothetical protein
MISEAWAWKATVGPCGGNTSVKTITLRLDEETASRLERLAEARQVTLEDLVKEWTNRTAVPKPPGKFPVRRMTEEEAKDMDEIVEEAMQARERRFAPKPPAVRPAKKGPSTGPSLLKFAGTWVGDDLEDCLRLVYETRSKFEV